MDLKIAKKVSVLYQRREELEEEIGKIDQELEGILKAPTTAPLQKNESGVVEMLASAIKNNDNKPLDARTLVSKIKEQGWSPGVKYPYQKVYAVLGSDPRFRKYKTGKGKIRWSLTKSAVRKEF